MYLVAGIFRGQKFVERRTENGRNQEAVTLIRTVLARTETINVNWNESVLAASYHRRHTAVIRGATRACNKALCTKCRIENPKGSTSRDNPTHAKCVYYISHRLRGETVVGSFLWTSKIQSLFELLNATYRNNKGSCRWLLIAAHLRRRSLHRSSMRSASATWKIRHLLFLFINLGTASIDGKGAEFRKGRRCLYWKNGTTLL